METRLLAYDRAESLSEIAHWANELIGKAMPDAPRWQVVSIVRFQVVTSQNTYAALLLVEVTESGLEEMERVELRAEDIQIIEELTSSIDEGTPEGGRVAEL